MGAIMHLLNMVMPPSKSSGGMNRLVCWLAEEQARQGHKVYVGSPEGESTEYFKHISLAKKGTLEDLQAKMPTDVTDVEMHEMPQDVTRWVYDNYPRSFSVIHGGLRPESQPEGGWSGAKAVFVSRSHMELAGGSQFAYNGVPVDEYDFSETKDDYLLFLAKVKRSKKGVQTAIRVAKRCKRKLIVAGGVRRGSPATWFPWHPLIRPIGYVDGARKRMSETELIAHLIEERARSAEQSQCLARADSMGGTVWPHRGRGHAVGNACHRVSARGDARTCCRWCHGVSLRYRG